MARVYPKVTPQKAPTATASAARPKVGAGGDKVKRSAGSAAAAKKTLSAEEATQGIAAAMQGLEGAASAPNGAVAPPAGPAGALTVGKRVKITDDTETLQLKKIKYAGKEGTITEAQGDSAWWVSFKGAKGGIACFDATELVAA